MSWGSNTLCDKDFYKMMARFADAKSLKTVERYWTAALEVIIRELYVNHACRVPMLGTFTVEELKESVQKQKDEKGRTVYYHVPDRIKPIFTPHDDFINDINMIAVTKLARRRARRGTETERDKIRRLRADVVSEFDLTSEEKMEKAQEEFKEVLRNKKKKITGKVDLSEDED